MGKIKIGSFRVLQRVEREGKSPLFLCAWDKPREDLLNRIDPRFWSIQNLFLAQQVEEDCPHKWIFIPTKIQDLQRIWTDRLAWFIHEAHFVLRVNTEDNQTRILPLYDT